MRADQRPQLNACRFDPSSNVGHYESYFQRANHPREPKAFWVRYTIFCPRGRPSDATGELWAIFFDGDAPAGRQVVAVKEVHPWSACSFSRTRLDARVAAATLDGERLFGTAGRADHTIAWDLRFTSPQAPLTSFPEHLIDKPLPKAKAVVTAPQAVYSGVLQVDGVTVPVDGWVGSQNHNWGSKHTDAYAWTQVAGFDGHPEVFLECGTGRLKFGPVWTPRFTVATVRIGEREYGVKGLLEAARAKGSYRFFEMILEREDADVRIRVRTQAPAACFVGLPYDNPPGGTKTCLNTKIAACELEVQPRGQLTQVYRTANRAAFEILTDRADHGIDMLR